MGDVRVAGVDGFDGAVVMADEERTVRYLPCGASHSPEALPHPTLTLAPHELRRFAP